MQMCLNKRESYEGGEVGRQILFFWCKSSTVLMFRRIRLAVTAHPLQGITYFFIFGLAFYKASGLKDPKSPHVGPSKGRKRFRDLNENRIGAFIAQAVRQNPSALSCVHTLRSPA